MISRPATGWECVHITVQGAFTTAELVAETIDRLRTHAGISHKVGDFLRTVLKGTSAEVGVGGARVMLSASFAETPLSTLSDVLTSVTKQLDDEDTRLVIVWNEFPDVMSAIAWTEGESAAVGVLGALRALRESPSVDRIRWILTGSFGLHHVLRGLPKGTDKVNDVEHASLGPLDPEWAVWLTHSY